MKYWNNEGEHTTLFDSIWFEHIPVQGESEDAHGELVRCFGRINYDMGNNGAGNIWEETDDSFYYDDDEDDIGLLYDIEMELCESWVYFFERLETVLPSKLIESLREETMNLNRSGNFNNVYVIDEVGDALGKYIIEQGDSCNY